MSWCGHFSLFSLGQAGAPSAGLTSSGCAEVPSPSAGAVGLCFPQSYTSALKAAAAVVPARVDAKLICTGLDFSNL